MRPDSLLARECTLRLAFDNLAALEHELYRCYYRRLEPLKRKKFEKFAAHFRNVGIGILTPTFFTGNLTPAFSLSVPLEKTPERKNKAPVCAAVMSAGSSSILHVKTRG